MKITIGLAAILLVCFVSSIRAADKPSTTASPAKAATPSKDVKEAIKKAKEAQKNKNDCYAQCANIETYEPICAHDPQNPAAKPRTFGNECVLRAHNCDLGTKLVPKSKGECPGTDGARLS